MKALTYFSGIILPLTLVTAAGFLAFFVNPDSGERIGLGITVLLRRAVAVLRSTSHVPRIAVVRAVVVTRVSAVGSR